MKTTTNFLERAMSQISDDPKSRLKDPVKQVLLNNNFVIDNHAHFFDGKCINVLYFMSRILAGAKKSEERIAKEIILGKNSKYLNSNHSISQIIEEMYDEEDAAFFTEDLDAVLIRIQRTIAEIEAEEKMALTSSKGAKVFIKKLKDVINILYSSNMSSVYDNFTNKFSIDNIYNKERGTKKELLSIGLGMDLTIGFENTIKKSYEKQVEELYQLSLKQPILPFLPIDPRRENMEEIFLEAFNAQNPKYYGIKVYPAMGYLPSDYRLKNIFRICAEKQIPVLSHCGGEMVSTRVKKIPVYDGDKKLTIKHLFRKNRARRLNNPENWITVLNEKGNENLILCLAHFGGDTAWKRNNLNSGRIKTILSMLNSYPNVYTDFSYNLGTQKALINFHNFIQGNSSDSRIAQRRTMFGTDYWVVLPLKDINEGQRKFLDIKEPQLDMLLKDNAMSFLGLD